ncbi:hypothetical protein BH23THE1_BH23THE1_33460 [soil metagenome]
MGDTSSGKRSVLTALSDISISLNNNNLESLCF